MSVKEAADIILTSTLEIEGIDSGGVYIVLESGDLDLINHTGLTNEFVQQIGHLPADTPQTKLVMTGNPIYANFEEIPGVDEVQLREGLKSLAVVPIKHEDRVVAVMNLASHSHAVIPEDSRIFLETLGMQVGEVIVRAKTQKELKDAQDRLLRQERLAILGKLSGGIGHELRNPLTSIKNSVYLLKMILTEAEPDINEALEIIEKEIHTSERIISGLLEFARPTKPTRQKFWINETLEELVSKLQIPENISVELDLEKSIPLFLADPVQMMQIFTNLSLNAFQAMPDGGSLTISTILIQDGWLAISFKDTGIGISEDIKRRLFEPLFTTKPKGIGLGLAIVKILVEAHEGKIDVESEVGSGTTFTIKLPPPIERPI
jgi:signal transduction histidine kinase